MRALVIDDSRTVRLIVGRMLRALDIDVLEAADGDEALRQLAGHPDLGLLLVDWHMPGMTGLDVVRAVRAQPAHAAVRILMVTVESHAAQVSQALDAGADEYLMKPFDQDALAAKLRLLDVLKE